MISEIQEAKKVIELLNSGFEIKKINTSFSPGQSEITTKISLTNGIKSIEITGGTEFSIFASKFKKVIDNYNNYKFVYLEENDNKIAAENTSKVYEPLNKNFKFCISGYDFIEGVKVDNFLKSIPSSMGFTHANVCLDMEMPQNLAFKDIDFKDEVLLIDIESEKIVFRGYVEEYTSSNHLAFLRLRDQMLKMEIGKTTMEFYQISPADQFQIVLDHSNSDYSLNLEFKPVGIEHNTNTRKFIVITPIHNLIIDNILKIGSVCFYQEHNSIDDRFIRNSELVRNDDDWNGNFPRAKVIVEANNYYSAAKIGYKNISTAIDILALRSDLAFPKIPLPKETDFVFNHYQHYSRVLLSEWVYCRDTTSPQQGHIITKLNSVIDNQLSLPHDSQRYMNNLEKIFERLITNEDLSQEEDNFIQSLHWLRRAIQTNNKKDKLMDLWTSFEFLISGSPDPEMFSKQEKKKLRRLVDLNKELSDSQIKLLKNAINNINFSPLMKKFESLLSEIGLQFSEWEMGVIRSSRNNRNSLIHGRKDVELNDYELDKMTSIIEKLLIYKLKSKVPQNEHAIKPTQITIKNKKSRARRKIK